MDGADEMGVTARGGTVGDRLRAGREAEGMTLEDVAARTRVPRRHLAMIEEGAYEGLPAATYSTGFVKAYARVLGLDGQALSDDFRREIDSAVVRPVRPEPYEPADPRRTPPLGLALVALLVAIVAGLGFLYWRGSADRPVEIAAQGVPQAPAAIPAAAPPVSPPVGAAAVPVAAGASGPVVVGAREDVWVKVSGGGRTVFMGLLKPGNEVRVPADAADPMLTTGRPGVTTISVGTTVIPPVGDPDKAAHGISLKPEALLARLTATPATPGAAPTAPTDASGPA